MKIICIRSRKLSIKLDSIFNFKVTLDIGLSSLVKHWSVTVLETRKLTGVATAMFCKSGPFHHKSLVSSSFTSIPRERTSAGLIFDEICFHWKSLDNCWIYDIRLPTKVFSWFGGY
ncbi:uncharacterized protein TNIN_252571 [Trichonephila inaurata madagascariensis]|uniref:Uncharacterized protein n=1 Tax=Trichonephila inaurata madagascariensis TaxID=2747483 RepID=A0A8X6YFW9_9ARAC|nr:uncharacterized protein TNIN_252571 [Trichonephila inaurata madagascariensis]